MSQQEEENHDRVLISESRHGSHWTQTMRHRPLHSTSLPGRVLFIIGHLLLLPFTLLGVALVFVLYHIWMRRARGYCPPDVKLHPGAQQIIDTPDVSLPFVYGIRPQAQPIVSVVMPFYNREDLVDWAVGSVLRQIVPPDVEIEIIAVDNGSTDGTVEKLKRHPVRLVHCAQRGPGAARNAGIAAARAPIVAFTDSDCVVDTLWLMRLIEPFSDPDVLITGGHLEGLVQDGYVASFTNAARLLDNFRFFSGSAYFPPFFATANAAYRKEALDKVHGFDNNLWMSEDADLAWRVMDLDGKMVFVENAIVFHRHRETLQGLFGQAVDYGTASVAIFAKHRSRLQATAVISWQNLREFAWLPIGLALLPFRSKKDRRYEIYYTIWRAGFTLGTVRGSRKYKTLFF